MKFGWSSGKDSLIWVYTMWENETFTAMQNCFRQINFFKENEKVVFTKFLQQIGRTQCAVSVSSQCGNYGILVSHFFGKNFVKTTVLLNKSLKS